MKVSQIYDVIVKNSKKTADELPERSIEKLKKAVEDTDVDIPLKEIIKLKYSEFIYGYAYVSKDTGKDNIIFKVYCGMDSVETLTVELKRKPK